MFLKIFTAAKNFFKKIFLFQIFFYPGMGLRVSPMRLMLFYSSRLRFLPCQVHARNNEATC